MTYSLTPLSDPPRQPSNIIDSSAPTLVLNVTHAENSTYTETTASSSDKKSTTVSDNEEACPDYNDVMSY